jgi:hypothetical protein
VDLSQLEVVERRYNGGKMADDKLENGKGALDYVRRYAHPSLKPIIDAILKEPQILRNIHVADLDSHTHEMLHLVRGFSDAHPISIWVHGAGILLKPYEELAKRFTDIESLLVVVREWSSQRVGE